MIYTLFANTPSRNATRPGASKAYSPVSVDTLRKPRLRNGSTDAGHEPSGGSILGTEAILADGRCAEFGELRRGPRDLRDLRDVRRAQRFQDEQGWSVFEHLLEDVTIQASATAREGATLMGGVSGPHPWRRPV
ncbi:hypothetical protein [Actinomadura sp. WMMB 499]|uniref:hypothetical protein n=1 Tax=Actinomadura sp. WMMB 499 TaxID=1219491 RepID=UPI001248A04C|nr:hypothetical protein [Actinomadura sp. WMMB 499]QFG25049.1 hypothetical protein F7P10_31840 [Actinomadura sp. WMMB 499]